MQPVIFHHTKILSLSRHNRAVINRLHIGHARFTNYLLKVDTLKELFEIVDSRNIIAFVKDINFYRDI